MSAETLTPYKKYLAGMMSQCKYKEYISTDFDEVKFDIIVNGQSKESQGKGYRAYLNSIVAFSYLRFMAEKAKSHIPFLILDSPLLSLKESDDEKDNTSDSMKKGLLKYIIEHQSVGQIIIAENDLPEMDYQGVKIFEFTGLDSRGRKGFIV